MMMASHRIVVRLFVNSYKFIMRGRSMAWLERAMIWAVFVPPKLYQVKTTTLPPRYPLDNGCAAADLLL